MPRSPRPSPGELAVPRSEGALVGQNEHPLATIQQLDPIHADVTQSTRELNALRRALRAGELQQVGDGQARATLIQDDGSAYPLPGKLLFSDISVDPSTNQITLRSEFPNPDLDLLPGSYVRVRLEQAVQPRPECAAAPFCVTAPGSQGTGGRPAGAGERARGGAGQYPGRPLDRQRRPGRW